MELTFLQQSIAFLYSLILGVGAGVFYGVIKIIRISLCPDKVMLFVLDFVFTFSLSLALYIFSIAYLIGFVRVYAIIGIVLGFAVYRLTVGRILEKIYCPVINFIHTLVFKILTKIKKITKKLLKIAYKILYNVSNIRSIFRCKRESAKKIKDNIDDEKSKGQH